MINISLLGKAKKEDLIIDPFPYIVIENAIDDELYEELSSSYPSDEDIIGCPDEIALKRNNVRYEVQASEIIKKDWLSPVWRDFIEYHTSRSFYEEFFDMFGEYIPRRLKFTRSSSLGVREKGVKIFPHELALDCQIGINSPVTEFSTVKGPHLDNQVELFAGLFYLKKDADGSDGGNLEIFKAKDTTQRFVPKQEIDPSILEKVNEVPYKKNTFVIFLCSALSIHGVSPRSVTNHSRRLVNVIGELGSDRPWKEMPGRNGYR